MPTLNSSIPQLREGLTNIIAKGYAETSKWGAHLLNVIQPVVRPLAVQMQKNHYVAIAVFTFANGIFLLVFHLLTQRKSGNELEKGHLFRRRVKMIFVELMLVGGSVAAYNVLLSKATEYRLSYVALTGIAASALALRLILKKPELRAGSHPDNNSTTIPFQPTPSHSQDMRLSSSPPDDSQDMRLSSSHPDNSQDMRLSSSNPTLPSSFSFNSLEGGNSTANDVEASTTQKFTREWLLEELEVLNDDEAIDFFIDCHTEAEQKTIYKLINTIQKEQIAAAGSQAPPSPSALSYSGSDTPPPFPPPPPPGPPPPPPPPPPGPPPPVQPFKPLIISKSASSVSTTNTNDASNIAAEAAASRGKLRPPSERTPHTPPGPDATDIAAQAANFRFKPASERKTPTQRPVSNVTPEALRITLRPASERKTPTQPPVSNSDSKMQALQNALARTLNARRGVMSEDHGTKSDEDEDEWEKGDLNTSKPSDEKLREQGGLNVNI